MSIKGIVFDKDGVLFDFKATWEVWTERFLLRVCAGDRGKAQKIGQTVGFDLDARQFEPGSVIIAGTLEEIRQALAPHMETGDAFLDLLVEEASGATQVEVVPLRPLLMELRARGLRLGVATNDGYEPAMAHLDSVEAVDCFDFIAGYDSGFGAKPGPGQLQAFCAQTGLDPQACLMVGDSLHDIRAGQAAGMRTLGVLTGVATTEDLTPHAHAVLPDIGHIPAWLDAERS